MGKIVDLHDGTYNLYDYSPAGHIFRATRDDLHVLVFDLIDLLKDQPKPLKLQETPEDHELAD